MSWQDLINPQTAVWRGVEAYALERIGQLTTACINPRSTDAEIRQAQAAMTEMHALLSLPDRLKMQAQQRSGTDRTQGY